MIWSVFSSASRSLSELLVVVNGSLRNDIENIRSCFFHLLLACSVIVAVGVVVEGIEHLLSTGKPFVDTETGVFNATPLINWHKKLERLGWLLVILGVVGEGIFEAATTSADNILQDFNNTLLAVTTEQAGHAATSAKTAHGEADAVAQQADDLLTKYVKAEKELEEERKARGEYEAKNAPRRLSSEQSKLIKSRLFRFKVWTISLFADTKNTEMLDFAADLEKLFRDAGFTVVSKQVMVMFEQGSTPERQRGLELLIGADRRKDAALLLETFRDAGLTGPDKPIHPGQSQNKDELRLTVLSK